MIRGTLVLLVLACCRSSAPSPATAPLPLEPAPAAAEPAPPEPTRPGVTLSSTPIHQQLAWFVDVLGTRNGVVQPDELAQHCEKKLLGPVSGMSDSLRGWATPNLVVEKLEVDDPTYVRAILVAGDKRHGVIMTIDATSSKIDYLRYEDLK